MALRAILVHTAIAQQDLPQNTNVSAGQAVYVYESDGATLLGQAMYAAADGGAPLLQPVFADNLGVLTVYAERAQSVVLKANNVAYQSAFTPWPQVPFWYEDVRAYGARFGSTNPADDDYDPSLPASTPFDNRAAIQEAIDVVIARNGGTVMIPELYHVAGAAIVINTNRVPFVSVDLLGANRWRSGLIQETPGIDVVQFGKNDNIAEVYASSADSCGISNLTLRGGRRAISLNNAINGHFSRLILDRNQVGVYAMGQNENHDFQDIFFTAQTQFGMDIGELNSPANGGTAAADVNQEIQKSTFRKLRFQIAATCTNAIKITGGAGVTGNLEFDGITLEGGPGNLVSVDTCFQAIFRRVTNEGTTPMTPNTYSVFRQGVSCLRLIIEDSLLTACDNYGNTWKHIVEQTDGRLFMKEVIVGGVSGHPSTAGSGAIYVNGIGATIVGGGVGGNTEIVLASTIARANSLVLNVETSDTMVPIRNWDDVTDSFPFIAGDALGLSMARGRHSGQQQKLTEQGLYGILQPGQVLALGIIAARVVLWDNANASHAEFVLNGAFHTVTEISDPGNVLIVNPPGTGTIWEVGWNGATSYILTNKTAAPRSYSILTTVLEG